MATVNINQDTVRVGPVHHYIPAPQWPQHQVLQINPAGGQQVIQVPAPIPPPSQPLPVPPPGPFHGSGPSYYMGNTNQYYLSGGPVQIGHSSTPHPIAIAHAPQGPIPYRGATRAEIENSGINAVAINGPKNANQSEQFFVRELDGTYSLHTIQDIVQNLRPGQWFQSRDGYPYFVRAGNASN